MTIAAADAAASHAPGTVPAVTTSATTTTSSSSSSPTALGEGGLQSKAGVGKNGGGGEDRGNRQGEDGQRDACAVSMTRQGKRPPAVRGQAIAAQDARPCVIIWTKPHNGIAAWHGCDVAKDALGSRLEMEVKRREAA